MPHQMIIIHIIPTFVIRVITIITSIIMITIVNIITIITTFVIGVAISFSFLARPQLLMISQHQAQHSQFFYDCDDDAI